MTFLKTTSQYLNVKMKISPPPAHLELNKGDLHLWFAPLSCSPSELMQLKSYLSPEELSRSERFKAEKAKRQFIVGRGVLRAILSRYLTQPAKQILFDYEKMGKPFLAKKMQHPHPQIAFNLTHSHDLALYSIIQAASIGVDLEYRKRSLSFDDLAQRFFSPAEFQEIQQAQGTQKASAFYHIWTKKEALLKALGLGLHGPLQQFTVIGKPNQEEIFSSLPFDPIHQTWFLYSWDYNPEFSFSVAVNQKPQKIHFWRLNENFLP